MIVGMDGNVERLTKGVEVVFQIEKKTFKMEAGTNAAGSYLKIIETASGRHNMIVIPESGVMEFRDQLNRFVK